jgi:large conductance mechanosensitive channel
MLKEFRDFLLRGNVIDLGVAVVIGAAFTAVVNSFVADILTPLLGLLGLPNFKSATIQIGSAVISYGLFLNAVITFVFVGVAVFFFVVRPLQRIAALNKSKEQAVPLPPTELTVLEEIRDELRAQRGGLVAPTTPGSVELRSDAGNPAEG